VAECGIGNHYYSKALVAIDYNTHQPVVYNDQYTGGRFAVGGPTVTDVSAANVLDPFGFEFAERSMVFYARRTGGGLSTYWTTDGYNWNRVDTGLAISQVSACAGGYAFAIDTNGRVNFVNPRGGTVTLGSPNSWDPVVEISAGVTASVSSLGPSPIFQVFAIDSWSHAIYVHNTSYDPWGTRWRPVSPGGESYKHLSATVSSNPGATQVYAIDSQGALHEFWYQSLSLPPIIYPGWQDQPLPSAPGQSGGFTAVSGASENQVYVIDQGGNAYRYTSQGWTHVDSRVSELSDTGVGTFYDVNYPDPSLSWTFAISFVPWRNDNGAWTPLPDWVV
jgi:hypothetical protein